LHSTPRAGTVTTGTTLTVITGTIHIVTTGTTRIGITGIIVIIVTTGTIVITVTIGTIVIGRTSTFRTAGTHTLAMRSRLLPTALPTLQRRSVMPWQSSVVLQ
jgi:hypothetical protein